MPTMSPPTEPMREATSPNAPGIFRRILARNLALPLMLGVLSALMAIYLLVYLAGAIADIQRSDALNDLVPIM